MKIFASSFVCAAVLSFAVVTVGALTGCSAAPSDAGASSTGSAETVQVDTRSFVLTGRQYGALPVQSDVSISVSYFIDRTANGGTPIETLTAEDLGIRVSDPLATSDDQYRLFIRNSDTQGHTDTYDVAMVNQNGAYDAEEIGDPGATLSDGSSSIAFYRYDGSEGDEDQTRTVTFELDKLIGGNWVPLMDPISGENVFTPAMYDASKLNTY